jgi:hypothetical protein
MNGLSFPQRKALHALAAKTVPTFPWHIGTTWKTLTALHRKGLVAWRCVGFTPTGRIVEGAAITDAGRKRLPIEASV